MKLTESVICPASPECEWSAWASIDTDGETSWRSGVLREALHDARRAHVRDVHVVELTP